MPLELKELHGSVPSMDFRSLLERSHSKLSSNQLRDNLTKTNLVSEQVKQTWRKNPWEQGHAYQVYKRIDPERLRTGGSTLNLYAPSRHRLYLKYCRSCIGVMCLVNDWNEDVEIALNTKIAQVTNTELKKVVKNLNAVILDMSKKIAFQSEKLEGFEKGSKWWEDWADKQKISSEAELKINDLRSRKRRWEEIAGMSMEDQATMSQNFHAHKVNSKEKFDNLQGRFNEVVSTTEENDSKLHSEINALKDEIEERKRKEHDMEGEMEQLQKEKRKLKDDNNRLKRLNAQLNSSLDEKDRQMAQYRYQHNIAQHKPCSILTAS